MAIVSFTTRSSAVAEGPRDALCQLKSAKCCTTVRRIAFEKPCNTFEVIQNHWKCQEAISHIVAAPRLVTSIPQMALRDDAAADAVDAAAAAAAAAAARDTSVDGAA